MKLLDFAEFKLFGRDWCDFDWRATGRELGQDEIVVDLFCGAGGASLGIEAGLERSVTEAVNHSPTAIAVHKANHGRANHHETGVFDVHPRTVARGRRIGLLWLSPDCTHFSNAKGGVPRDQGIRSLAWIAVRYARVERPRVITLENVREFLGWGPLGPDGRPDKARKGETFRLWKRALERLGYVVEYRVLDASEFGAPTKRKRLFVVARCDGQPIRWPEPTHGRGRKPLRTAAECIDWSIPVPSIFGRKKPLADKTLWRVAQGIKRFVIDSPSPFIVKVNHGGADPRVESLAEPMTTVTASQRGHALVTPVLVEPGQRHGRGQASGDVPLSTIVAKDRHAIVAPTLVQTGYGERKGQAPRVLDLHEPLGTVVGCGQRHALVESTLVAAHIVKSFGDPTDPSRTPVLGADVRDPMGTVTARDHHSLGAVTLAHFRGTDPSQPGSADVNAPLPTISAGGIHEGEVLAQLELAEAFPRYEETKAFLASFGVSNEVVVGGVTYFIVDIGLRMLEPAELLRAQFGRFAATYDMSAATTKGAQVRLIGNSVCPELAEALLRSVFFSTTTHGQQNLFERLEAA